MNPTKRIIEAKHGACALARTKFPQFDQKRWLAFSVRAMGQMGAVMHSMKLMVSY